MSCRVALISGSASHATASRHHVTSQGEFDQLADETMKWCRVQFDNPSSSTPQDAVQCAQQYAEKLYRFQSAWQGLPSNLQAECEMDRSVRRRLMLVLLLLLSPTRLFLPPLSLSAVGRRRAPGVAQPCPGAAREGTYCLSALAA